MASALGDELRLDDVGCRDLLEVGGVLDGSWGAWAVEVKTGPIAAADLRGLGEFARRLPGYRPLVVCDDAGRLAAERSGFESLGWRDFLLDGLRRA